MADQPAKPQHEAIAEPKAVSDTSGSFRKRYGKRGRHRTHRYQILRRSQNRLGWSLATGTFAGITLGLLFGNLAVGIGIGLTLGLAVGLLIAG